MKNKIIPIVIIVLAALACGFAVWKSHAPATPSDAAILACYHQEPGSDANRPIPNNSVQQVKETTRMFINMPKSLYPKEFPDSWTTVSGNATGGWVSNGGLPGESYYATSECWSTYVDFEGSGEVDLLVKSLVPGAPDYFVRFIVTPV